MVNCKWFKGISTLEGLKAEYKKLVKKFHPDITGGDDKEIKEINTEYELMFEYLKKHSSNKQETSKNNAHRVNDGYREAILSIIHLEGLIIEICGSWVWVSGETKANKEELKKAGYKFAPKKRMWFWRSPEDKTYNKKAMSMDYIRSKYGSERLESEGKIKITSGK